MAESGWVSAPACESEDCEGEDEEAEGVGSAEAEDAEEDYDGADDGDAEDGDAEADGDADEEPDAPLVSKPESAAIFRAAVSPYAGSVDLLVTSRTALSLVYSHERRPEPMSILYPEPIVVTVMPLSANNSGCEYA